MQEEPPFVRVLPLSLSQPDQPNPNHSRQLSGHIPDKSRPVLCQFTATRVDCQPEGLISKSSVGAVAVGGRGVLQNYSHPSDK